MGAAWTEARERREVHVDQHIDKTKETVMHCLATAAPGPLDPTPATPSNPRRRGRYVAARAALLGMLATAACGAGNERNAALDEEAVFSAPLELTIDCHDERTVRRVKSIAECPTGLVAVVSASPDASVLISRGAPGPLYFRLKAGRGDDTMDYSECHPASSVRCEEFADLCANDGCGGSSTPDGGVGCSCTDE
jgi:hypothetical protein